jgi:hypothetical protein
LPSDINDQSALHVEAAKKQNKQLSAEAVSLRGHGFEGPGVKVKISKMVLWINCMVKTTTF